jgi:valyl-tRNA synthetase
MNGCRRVDGFDPRAVEQTLNRWIVGEVQLATEAFDKAMESYRFNEAASGLYRFIWNTYCDWYLELSKPLLTGDAGAAQDETRATVAWARDEILKLLHPIMPFVTEELWRRVDDEASRDDHLVLTQWPTHTGLVDDAAKQEIEWVIELINAIRSARSEINVPAGSKVPLVFVSPDEMTRARSTTHAAALMRLARLETIDMADKAPEASLQIVTASGSAAMPLAGIIDFDAERQRLKREVAKLDGEITGIDKKLGNEKFLANAPDEVVAEQRDRLVQAQEKRGRLGNALTMLGG